MQGIGPRELPSFDPEHRAFATIMQRAAHQNFAEIDFQPKKWPLPEGRNLEADNFNFLDEPSYAADFHVCFVESLFDIGPEIAHLVYNRRRSALMVLIVSDKPVVNEYTEDIRRGLGAVAASDFQRAEGNIVTPAMYTGETYNAESAGKIAYFYVRDRANALERLEMIFL